MYRKPFVRPSGFEPETDGLENRCSIQLSYGRLYCFSGANIKKIIVEKTFWINSALFLLKPNIKLLSFSSHYIFYSSKQVRQEQFIRIIFRAMA